MAGAARDERDEQEGGGREQADDARRACGHATEPVHVCAHCGEELEPSEVQIHPGPGATPEIVAAGVLPRERAGAGG